MIEKVKVYRDQNIVDMVLQEYGSVEAIVQYAKKNGLAVDQDPAVEAITDVDPVDVLSESTREFYDSRNHLVATGRTYETIPDEGEEEEEEDDGIHDDSYDDSYD